MKFPEFLPEDPNDPLIDIPPYKRIAFYDAMDRFLSERVVPGDRSLMVQLIESHPSVLKYYVRTKKELDRVDLLLPGEGPPGVFRAVEAPALPHTLTKLEIKLRTDRRQQADILSGKQRRRSKRKSKKSNNPRLPAGPDGSKLLESRVASEKLKPLKAKLGGDQKRSRKKSPLNVAKILTVNEVGTYRGGLLDEDPRRRMVFPLSILLGILVIGLGITFMLYDNRQQLEPIVSFQEELAHIDPSLVDSSGWFRVSTETAASAGERFPQTWLEGTIFGFKIDEIVELSILLEARSKDFVYQLTKPWVELVDFEDMIAVPGIPLGPQIAEFNDSVDQATDNASGTESETDQSESVGQGDLEPLDPSEDTGA